MKLCRPPLTLYGLFKSPAQVGRFSTPYFIALFLCTDAGALFLKYVPIWLLFSVTFVYFPSHVSSSVSIVDVERSAGLLGDLQAVTSKYLAYEKKKILIL